MIQQMLVNIDLMVLDSHYGIKITLNLSSQEDVAGEPRNPYLDLHHRNPDYEQT